MLVIDVLPGQATKFASAHSSAKRQKETMCDGLAHAGNTGATVIPHRAEHLSNLPDMYRPFAVLALKWLSDAPTWI
ncbi:hypothetical protein D3C85_1519010 [compost metagenome]